MVTSVTQNTILLPNNTSIPVGTDPTVVIPLNNVNTTITSGGSPCANQTKTYTCPQSALVVNMGSANVSVVQIGSLFFPSGTIAVGQQPVAATLGPNGLVYVANYGSGTISEVNTTTMVQTRTLPVMQHPTSISFDAAGNLWVGGQGFVDQVNLANWSVSSSTPVDGTINGMVYAPTQKALVQVILQNGTVGNPVSGGTHANEVSFGSAQSSYSTVNVLGLSTLASSGPTLTAAANASYAQSPVASYLAFPAQTAIVPPTMTSSPSPLAIHSRSRIFPRASLSSAGQCPMPFAV